jgi:preprotein translocase subunit SecB
MLRKTISSTSNREKLMDVTSSETHFQVQCEDIRLITSTLKPLVVDKQKNIETRYAFRIRAVVEGQKSFSYLEVKVNYFFNSDEEAGLEGFNLFFVLMGTFGADEKMPQEDFVDFIKKYTLTILWPYAREYASDQFRRAGNHEIVLPIINPQVVTQHIVDNNLVEVEIIQPHAQA